MESHSRLEELPELIRKHEGFARNAGTFYHNFRRYTIPNEQSRTRQMVDAQKIVRVNTHPGFLGTKYTIFRDNSRVGYLSLQNVINENFARGTIDNLPEELNQVYGTDNPVVEKVKEIMKALSDRMRDFVLPMRNQDRNGNPLRMYAKVAGEEEFQKTRRYLMDFLNRYDERSLTQEEYEGFVNRPIRELVRPPVENPHSWP